MPRKSKKSEKALEQETIPQTETAKTEATTETPAIEDPIGDTTDGEAQVYLGEAELAAEEPAEVLPEEPAEEAEAESDTDEEDEAEFPAVARPEAKQERLQKILSQAGIASRRRAEMLITEGRVQINGTVVTTLGTKADPEHDHIRVDGKLLHGAERLRYFVLNKPKGFVTTVSDPEGRPTVMQFFQKMPERLYPVGRLDYQSEGLLLVTNDGDLANRLTKAGSGVEKTYLVKVAGQPTTEELETLRGGVTIERAQPGSKKVFTAPARIRQIRQGDNPWYEVVLIEGRNRELRKMFSAIGHFVEKIRRVGYGPLVLDVEPGVMRELEEEEVAALRLTAEGKRVTGRVRAKQKDFARHLDEAEAAILPSRPTRARTARPAGRSFEPREGRGEFKPRRTFDKPRFDSRTQEGRTGNKE
jgi:23S rRNA pseudouridine2605 synthase